MHYHAQGQFPPTDPETQALFDQGHRVTRLFQTLFPGGIEIQGFGTRTPTCGREYARVTFTDGVTEEDRRRVYDGLLEYCKLDTRAMIDIMNVLRAAAKSKG